MEHEDYKAIIDKYIEGIASTEEKDTLEKHLSHCADCRQEVEELSFIIKSTNSLSQLALPESFASSLHDKLLQLQAEKHEKTSEEKNWWSRLVIHIFDVYRTNKKALAAGFAVLIICIFMLQLFQGDPGYDFAIPGANKAAEIAKTEAESPEAGTNRLFSQEMASTDNSSQSSVAREDMLMKSSALGDVVAPEEANVAQKTRKIIKQASLTVYVEDFENKVEYTLSLPEKLGGYIENSNIYGGDADKSRRSAFIALRIPESELENVLTELRSLGRIGNENIIGQDITQNYYDTDARVNNLRQQETRLLEILKMAENVDEILRIENELNRVRTEIDQLTGQLQTWDKMIQLSLVEVHLIEEVPFREKVVPVTFHTLWEKAKEGFISTTNNMMKALAELARLAGSAIPFLAVMIIIVFGVIYIKRKRGKKS